MASCTILAEDNLAFLRQARDLVSRLSSSAYASTGHPVFGSGVGAHLRHVLDHYANLLAGVEAGRIDYDARAREQAIESDRAASLARMDELMAGLRGLAARADAPLRVKMDCGDQSDPAGWWTESSLRRELQFLISHTVHHFALIRLILKIQGIDAGAQFGVAPSTLRHHAQLACAQ
ncbi:MAG TPA: DUF664 domain-containing protein [Kiritimatiellia bacterium]|nr:DUF664 domain-containing protein [Kiritimatiellia bacterium]